jgi:hypothetical protein
MAKKSGRCALYCAIAAALLLCVLAFGCKEEKAGNPSGNGDNDIKLQEEITEGAEVKDETPGETEGKYGAFPGLDAETEKRILQEYFDAYVKPEDPGATVNDIWIAGYYGTYNGVVAVRFGDFFGSAGVETEEVIASIRFIYPDPKPNYAWKDGSLYRLQKAYDLGLLTDDDIKNIHEIYYEDWMGGNIHD